MAKLNSPGFMLISFCWRAGVDVTERTQVPGWLGTERPLKWLFLCC